VVFIRWLYTVLCCCILSFSWGQETLSTYLPKELKGEFTVLRNALEEAHAGLYDHTTKAEMDQFFDDLYQQLDHEMNAIEFYKVLTTMLPKIGNGHTNISLPDGVWDYIDKNARLFPAKIAILNNRVYLHKNWSPVKALPLGSEIVSINGKPGMEIVDQMLQHLTTDKANKTKNYLNLEYFFYYGYSLFIEQTKEYNLVLKNEAGKVEQYTLPGQPVDTIILYRDGKPKKEITSLPRYPITFEIKQNDKTALLDIAHFNKFLSTFAGQDYDKTIENAFKRIEEEKIEHLIIDLRGNSGGDAEPAIQLFSYLVDGAFSYTKSIEAATRDISFLEYVNTDYFNYRSYKKMVTKEKGKLVVTTRPGLGLQPPAKKHRYNGEVYVLVNGGTFSAASEFAACAHFNERATFIGTETGGNYYTHASGIVLDLQLPSSGFHVDIPLLKYEMDVTGYPKGQGLIPDHVIEPTIHDFLQEKDVQMEFVFDLIRKSKR
jgi:C-terminal processing protease CtpA/Prc